MEPSSSTWYCFSAVLCALVYRRHHPGQISPTTRYQYTLGVRLRIYSNLVRGTTVNRQLARHYSCTSTIATNSSMEVRRHHLQGGHADAAVKSGRSERQPGAHVVLTQVAKTVRNTKKKKKKNIEQEEKSGQESQIYILIVSDGNTPR